MTCILYNGSWHRLSECTWTSLQGSEKIPLAWQQGSVSNPQLSSHRGVSRWVTVGQRSVETIGSTMEFIYQEEYGGEECISIGRLNASQLFGYTVYAFQLFGYTVSQLSLCWNYWWWWQAYSRQDIFKGREWHKMFRFEEVLPWCPARENMHIHRVIWWLLGTHI